MDENVDDFLNRTAELGAFKGLLSHRHHRILLLHGPAGLGKSRLVHRLHQICREAHMVAAVVDFRANKTLTEPDRVIGRLRERLGGSFDNEMGRAEAQIQRELATGSRTQPQGQAGLLAGALSTQGPGPGGGVHLSGPVKVQVGGSIVGGDQLIIRDSTIVLNPGGGLDQVYGEAETRRNAAFRAALERFQAGKKVILFFDHFEEATGLVDSWLHNHVLDLHLGETGEFSNLWLVIAGRTVPLQDEVDEWRHMLRSQYIGPLPDEAVYLFWVDQRGLDRSIVNAFIKGSRRNTRLLSLMLNNYAEDLEADRPSG